MIHENLSNINPEPVLGALGRRDIIKAGVLALTPGLALLPQNASAADTVVTVTNKKVLTNTGKLFTGKNGLTYYMYSYSYTRAGRTEHAVIFEPTAPGARFGCRTWYNSSGVRQHSHHNSLNLLADNTLSYGPAIHTIPHSEVIGGHITTRNLTSTQWLLPSGALQTDEYYSLVDTGANVVDYVEYVGLGITYVKAEAYIYSNTLKDHSWVTTYGLSGANFIKFFELFNKWKTANIGAASRLGYYKTGKLTVVAAWGVAVGLAAFTGGASLAAMGAYTLTAATGAVGFTIAQQSDMIAVDEAVANLVAFVKAHTSPV